MPADLLPRGVAVNLDGAIPPAVIEAAVLRHQSRRWQSDLVRSGLARASDV